MSEHKSISNVVIDDDAFLDLPLHAQALYFHLVMKSDGFGIVNNARAITRMIQADERDLDLLLDKGFICQEDNAIFAITQWDLHSVDQEAE